MPEELLPADTDLIRQTRWLETLRADLAESVAGVALRGARAVPVGVTSGAVKRPTTVSNALVGFSLRNLSEDDDAVVRVLFHDGSDEDADVVLSVTLQPGESRLDWFGPGGINLTYGLFMNIDGQVEGAVYMRGVE